jgi:guanylate kinase
VLVAGSGVLFVLSAPSGTGKSTVARRLLARMPEMSFSVSYTTRPMRVGEREGHDYHFVGRDTFEGMVGQGAFLEWAAVFDQLYGTGREATGAALAGGRQLLLDIDVQGARQVRESGAPSVSVMLLPPDYATLVSRLEQRASESDAERSGRLGRARREAEDYRFFDYVVVNSEVERTVEELVSIVRAEGRRTRRAAEQAQRILATFPS